MTERSELFPSSDDALRLRLFDEPLAEAEASMESHCGSLDCDGDLQESDEPFEGELPHDLLELAERLAGEAHALASTYPAGSAERLPCGENEIVNATPVEATSPQAERVEDRSGSSRPARRSFGVGVAAAIGFAAIVGTAIYSAATGRSRDAVAEIDVLGDESPGAGASPIAGGTTGGLNSTKPRGVPVRTVSLSLANDRDYRRLESLLRDRSEPEREAMFDLLDERDGDEETAVRISF